MIELLCIFDNSDDFDCLELYKYLSFTFKSDKLNLAAISDPTSEIEKIKPKVILTTSPLVAATFADKYSLILYVISDLSDLDRNNNLLLHRKISGNIGKVKDIFTHSPFLAKSFYKIFKVACKLQYPYIEEKECNPVNIKHTDHFPWLLEFTSQYPNYTFELAETPFDLQNAKIFLYYPQSEDNAAIWFATASTYGIPVISLDWPNLREIGFPGNAWSKNDSSDWLYHFKNVLRDYTILARKTKEFGKRYRQMSELQNRIRKALKDVVPVNIHNSSFAELQKIASQRNNKNEMLPKLFARKIEKGNLKRPSMIMSLNLRQIHANILSYFNQHNDVYVGIGGIGDALLAIAGTYRLPNPHVVYACNAGVEEFVKGMFALFNIPCLIIPNLNGSLDGLQIYQQMTRHPNFKGAFHIPERLNYFEWKTNTEKYLKRIVNRMPLIEILGKLENPRQTKGIVGIGPRGSDHNNMGRQRFLTQIEYNSLVSNWLNKGYTVFSFGSEVDLHHYAPFPDNNVIWFSSDMSLSYPMPSYSISLKHMLRALNSCDLVISVDSWVKTYAGLAGIKTKVILTRCHGKPDVDQSDPSDHIFLNKKIWPFELCADLKQLLS
jgi:hypothetical protein